MVERALESVGASWTDLGDWIEHGGERDEGKYTEAELQEFAQARRAEGVEAGIKIGMSRASNGRGNGHLTLPKPSEMAEYCRERPGRLKDDTQREFVDDMYANTRRGISLGQLAIAVGSTSGEHLHPARREGLWQRCWRSGRL